MVPALLLLWCLGRAGVEIAMPPGERDFHSFVASARASVEGRDPYEPAEVVNANPPLSLVLFRPIAHADPQIAFRVAQAVDVLLLGALLLLLRRQFEVTPAMLAWVVALDGVWGTLRHGQVYFVLAIGAVTAWCWMESRRLLAGIALGAIAALKPNFLVVPVILLLAGHRRSAVAAFAVFLVGSALPAIALGPEIYSTWLRSSARLADASWLPVQVGVGGIPARLGVPALAAPLALTLLCVLAVWAWRRRPDPQLALVAGLAGAVLGAPVSWPGYTLMLVPHFLSVTWSPRLRASAVLLLLPDVVLWSVRDPLLLPLVGSLYTLAVLLVLADVVRCEWSSRAQPVPHESRHRDRAAELGRLAASQRHIE